MIPLAHVRCSSIPLRLSRIDAVPAAEHAIIIEQGTVQLTLLLSFSFFPLVCLALPCLVLVSLLTSLSRYIRKTLFLFRMEQESIEKKT